METIWVQLPLSAMRSESFASTVLYKEVFADLPAATAEAFKAVELRAWYGRGVTLFVEDQSASGIFVVHSGSIQLADSLREE